MRNTLNTVGFNVQVNLHDSVYCFLKWRSVPSAQATVEEMRCAFKTTLLNVGAL